jgi:hypothetical protein
MFDEVDARLFELELHRAASRKQAGFGKQK